MAAIEICVCVYLVLLNYKIKFQELYGSLLKYFFILSCHLLTDIIRLDAIVKVVSIRTNSIYVCYDGILFTESTQEKASIFARDN